MILEERKKEETSPGYRRIDPKSRYTPIPIAIKEETMNSPGKSIVVGKLLLSLCRNKL